MLLGAIHRVAVREPIHRPSLAAPAKLPDPSDQVQLGTSQPKTPAAQATPKDEVATEAQSTARTEANIQKLFQGKVNLQSLKATADGCVAGAKPIVQIGTYISPEGEVNLSYSADWRNARGEQVASADIFWMKQPDGSLTLQWRDVWLDPAQRGEGFIEKMASTQFQLLRDSTEHSESRLELVAGGSGKIGQAEQEIVGKYLWARLGLFEFGKDEVQARMAKAFGGWLEEKAKEYPALTPAMVEQLQTSCTRWSPEQFAEFDVPYIKVPVQRDDGRVRTCSLGKAFLLDRKTPGWFGNCLINQIPAEKWERAERVLSFGGRAHQVTPLEAGPELDTGMARQASDLSTPAKIRQRHACSLAALRGEARLSDFVQQFADLGTADQLAVHWRASTEKNPEFPPQGKLSAAISLALEDAFARAVQQLPQPVDSVWVKTVRMLHFGDFAAQQQALASH